jgi:hypothetical protein
MSKVRLLDIEQVEHEVFTRWDISGHQVNRHLLSKALTGTEGVVLDQMTFPPGFVTTYTGIPTPTWLSSR